MKVTWGLIGLLAFVLALHAGAIRNEFYWDDRPLIVEGHLVHSWRSIPTIFAHELYYNADLGKRAPQASVDTYRPLSNVSFLADNMIWKGAPQGFHLTNLLIHLINTLLLFVLARRFLSPGYSLFATALFSLHPLCLECIHYVAARTDSLSALFLLSATWFAVRKERMTGFDTTAMAATLLMGVFVKETALVFPIFLILILFVRRRSQGRWEIAPLAAAGLACALYVALRFHALGRMKALQDSAQLAEIFLNFPRLLLRFATMFFVPMHNMPMQWFQMIRPPAPLVTWVGAALAYLTLAGVILWSLRKRTLWAAPLVWAMLVLLPPFFAVSLTEVLNPRYLYPAVPAGAFLLALALQQAAPQRWIAMSVTFVVLSLCATQSARTSPRYRTGESFYRAILADRPHYPEAEYNLANTLVRKGRWSDAIPIYEETLTHVPQDVSVRNNLASGYLAIGRPEQAAHLLRNILERDPKNVRYLYNLSVAERLLGRGTESRRLLARALDGDPGYELAREELAELCRTGTAEELAPRCGF